MKKLILFISLFTFGNSFGQTFTFTNNSSFDIFSDNFEDCFGVTGNTYVLAPGSPTTLFGLATYARQSTFGFVSGGNFYTTPNPMGDNSFCAPTGLNLTEVATGGGNSVSFVWSVDLIGNVTVTAF